MELKFDWIFVAILNIAFYQVSFGRRFGVGVAGGFMGSGSYGIGVSCMYDDDCMLPHTFCHLQETCQCKQGFQPSEDGSQCVTLVGAYCQTQYDCNSLPHSECKQESCECAQGFVPNKRGTECLPQVTQYRGNCMLDSQCTSVMGSGSYCATRCECLSGFHFSSLETLCLANKGIYQSCRNNSECFIGDDYTSTIECYRGQCKCRYGYYITESSKCASSSYVIQSAPIILFLGIFITMNKFI